MAVNPSSGRGSFPSLPPSVFGPLVFVAFLANLDAMRLLGRLVYDTAVPGAVEGLQHRTSMPCKRGGMRLPFKISCITAEFAEEKIPNFDDVILVNPGVEWMGESGP